jgi:zinc/manganese transport system substrate-binding protein
MAPSSVRRQGLRNHCSLCVRLPAVVATLVTLIGMATLAGAGGWLVGSLAGASPVAASTGSSGTGSSRTALSGGSRDQGTVAAVAAENEYANVISQIGGRYVSVTAIMSNPNTDPHEFEASASVAVQVSQAQLVVQNGVGYDSFMNKIESASHVRGRKVIVVQDLLRLANNIFNPHLWYDPRTMPLVASAVEADLADLRPAHAGYFATNLRTFDHSLQTWFDALATFKAASPGTPVAVSEPVADYMLQAAGARIVTPDSLQSAIMNGTDPSPQDISIEENLIKNHKVKVFLYNQQVTDSLTAIFLADAKQAGVPVVGVYETMPVPGYDYQSWMLAEVHALQLAVEKRVSTVKL